MYGSNEKLDAFVMSKDWDDRRTIAEQSYGLDVLVNDENWHIREIVARQGYGLDKLIKDKNRFVRIEVAKHGYGLDTLVYDESEYVRACVAEQGYMLDVLINDPSGEVRKEVARLGYGLDKLVDDESSWVRSEVARQGYRLDYMLDKEKDIYTLRYIILVMSELGEFHWISLRKVKFLRKTELNLYFKLLLEHYNLTSDEFEKFKDIAEEAIELQSGEGAFVKTIGKICEKYNIKIEVYGV